ncbi:MAG: VanZ family protein [Deltaproteobacteria bacterium]|nr:VanZ family protein [Deltaproteobacteria bacterium]
MYCRRTKINIAHAIAMRMPSDHFPIAARRHRLRRISLWTAAALYTAALPYMILGFRAIDQHFSPQIAANVPLFIIILLAVFYAIACVRKNMAVRGVIILAASGLIVFFVMRFESNPNKYIHIPEYILMTWILYQALVLDYKGRGIMLLILICATMLGIVDELLQGIHPQRTFGWKDMIIDTASSFIGILTLMGVKRREPEDWLWLGRLKHFKLFLAAILCGALTAIPMCIYLFDVQVEGSFANIYPRWLLTLNGLFTAATAALIVFFCSHRHRPDRPTSTTDVNLSIHHTTALLWVMCPLAILFSMHALVVWVAVAGKEFR